MGYTGYKNCLVGNPLVSTWQVKCPVYIVHGTNDEVISYSHAEDLVRNCQEGIAYPPYMVENGGHNNLEVETWKGPLGPGQLEVDVFVAEPPPGSVSYVMGVCGR